MKKLIILILSLSMLLSINFTAFAQGSGYFTDVSASAWYADYIDICYESGLVKGVGNNRFNPDGKMTIAEALTLCVRIHNYLTSGDNRIPDLPEGGLKGLVYFTDMEGNRVASLNDLTDWQMTYSTGGLSVYFEREVMAQLRKDDAPLDTIILVSLIDGEKRFTGAYYVSDDGTEQYVISIPEGQDVGIGIQYEMAYLSWFFEGLPEHWANNAYYSFFNIIANLSPDKEESFDELMDAVEQQYPELEALLSTPTIPLDAPCPRAIFVVFLYACIPDEHLSPINAVGTLPELDTYGLRSLYNAGIISGVDKSGTLNGANTMTRAQAATVAARVLNADLRLKLAF